MIIRRFRTSLLLALFLAPALVALVTHPAGADPDDETGKAVQKAFAANSRYLVTVSYSRMMEAGGMGQQDTGGTLTGTLVDPTGIVMISGQDFFGSGGISGIARLMGGGGTSEPTNFRVRLASGTEFAADFIGGDKDTNVAFVRAKLEDGMTMPTTPFDPIAAQSMEIGQRVILLGTYPDFLGHARKFHLGRINAIIDKDKGIFGIDGPASECTGGLVLTMDGKPVGVVLERGNPQANPAAGGIGRLIRGVTEGGEGLRIALGCSPKTFAAALGAAKKRAEQPAPQAAPETAPDANGDAPKALGLTRFQALSTDNINVLKNLGYNVDGVSGGIVVMGVAADSPFARAGLKSGDVIVSVGDSTLAEVNDESGYAAFTAALVAASDAGTFQLDVRRRTESLKLDVTVKQ